MGWRRWGSASADGDGRRHRLGAVLHRNREEDEGEGEEGAAEGDLLLPKAGPTWGAEGLPHQPGMRELDRGVYPS